MQIILLLIIICAFVFLYFTQRNAMLVIDYSGYTPVIRIIIHFIIASDINLNTRRRFTRHFALYVQTPKTNRGTIPHFCLLSRLSRS